MTKDPPIVEAVEFLESRFGPDSIAVHDLWDADLCATGVIRPGKPLPLVYFSCWRCPPGRFFVSLDGCPRAGEQDYEPVGDFEDVDMEALAEIVAKHLGL